MKRATATRRMFVWLMEDTDAWRDADKMNYARAFGVSRTMIGLDVAAYWTARRKLEPVKVCDLDHEAYAKRRREREAKEGLWRSQPRRCL